jgi:DNA polymerase III alpha subunit
MQIAQTLGRLSLAEADLVRRSSAKYSGQRDYQRLRGKFEKAAEMMGLNAQKREETWMMVEKFAGFGFCKAHAGTYADISYRMTYLKTHHTAEFLAAMCSAGAGFYHVSAYVEEAKRWGIDVRLPSVNRSRMEYTAECGADGRKALRVGLLQVRGLRVETILAIVREREAQGAFRSLEDFLSRVPAERDEIEALIKCGAFDDVCGMTRPAMLWEWNLLQGRRRESGEWQIASSKFRKRQEGMPFDGGQSQEQAGQDRPPQREATAGVLFADMEQDDPIGESLRKIEAPDYTREQKLRYEREILEVCVSGHPLDFLPRNDETWSDALPGLRGKRVTLCGWVVTYRHVGTKNYRNMMFVTLEDQRGLFEAILFPDAYDKYGGLIYETRAMRVTGVVMEGEHINGEKLESLK